MNVGADLIYGADLLNEWNYDLGFLGGVNTLNTTVENNVANMVSTFQSAFPTIPCSVSTYIADQFGVAATGTAGTVLNGTSGQYQFLHFIASICPFVDYHPYYGFDGLYGPDLSPGIVPFVTKIPFLEAQPWMQGKRHFVGECGVNNQNLYSIRYNWVLEVAKHANRTMSLGANLFCDESFEPNPGAGSFGMEFESQVATSSGQLTAFATWPGYIN
jgi:hypothetical protein